MANPMPLPPILVVKYRSKILSRISLGMPMPSSATRSSAACAAACGSDRWNPVTLRRLDLVFVLIPVQFESDLETTAVRHGLRAILNDVEHGLLQQVSIHIRNQWFGGYAADQRDPAHGQLVRSQREDVADDRAKVLLSELHLHRPCDSTHQRLHHAVQAAGSPRRLRPGAWWQVLRFAQLRLEKLQMHDNRVDRVLDLMAYSRGEPADGCHAPRELKLRLEFAPPTPGRAT